MPAFVKLGDIKADTANSVVVQPESFIMPTDGDDILVVKPEANPDTGEVPLRTGIANAILDKKKDTKDLVQSKKKKEIKVGGKTNIEINPDVDIGNFSGGMKTNADNLH